MLADWPLIIRLDALALHFVSYGQHILPPRPSKVHESEPRERERESKHVKVCVDKQAIDKLVDDFISISTDSLCQLLRPRLDSTFSTSTHYGLVADSLASSFAQSHLIHLRARGSSLGLAERLL